MFKNEKNFNKMDKQKIIVLLSEQTNFSICKRAGHHQNEGFIQISAKQLFASNTEPAERRQNVIKKLLTSICTDDEIEEHTLHCI